MNEGRELGDGIDAVRWTCEQEKETLDAKIQAVAYSIHHDAVLLDNLYDLISKMEQKHKALKLQTTPKVHAELHMRIERSHRTT